MEDAHTASTNLHDLAALGSEMHTILGSDAYKAGVGLAQARIFERWTASASQAEREALHAEWRALERVQQAFKTIDDDGAVAQEAIRSTQG